MPANAPSKKFYDLIELWEERSAFVYLDSGGAPTIGIGHLLTKSERMSGKILIGSTPVRYANGLTAGQIDQLLKQDTSVAVQAINRLVKVDLSQNQFDALTSFVFNIGTGKDGFAGSTLLKKLNNGQYGDVPAEMRRWIYDNGKQVVGLRNRREKEVALWCA